MLLRFPNRAFVVLLSPQLEVLEGVVDLSTERFHEIDPLLSDRALAHQRLRFLLIIPEVGLARQLVEFFDLSLQLRNVKETPLAP